ncbi:MAG: VWA domain-containing protein [Treponemataceae bacterium]|nr:VWA domain-containing protein [Treponemataceae bacterium]
MEKKAFFAGCAAVLLALPLAAEQPLLIRPADVRLVPDNAGGFEGAGGYHLYIRKKDGLESVLLTETTKDPEGKEDNYAYRALEYNPINGDEVRILDGRPLDSPGARWSLIDSTPEPDAEFGEAFHIYIPGRMQFGYPWSRNGTTDIGRGTFVNLRAFSKKYGDYSGEFYDNPYMFDLAQLPAEAAPASVPPAPPDGVPADDGPAVMPVLTDDYSPAASAAFSELSERLVYSKGPGSIVEDIMASVRALPAGADIDVVFVVDATGSMKDDIDAVRARLFGQLADGLSPLRSFQIGLVLYRDYGDSFRYKNLPVKVFGFTDDLAAFEKNMNGFTIRGKEGGDIPEAVYEGLYAGVEFMDWRAGAMKKIILIGDAEPHPVPRGSGTYTRQFVLDAAKAKGVSIDAIIVPDEKSRRGR